MGIIGAGIAGEVAAFFLLKDAHRVCLYDPGERRAQASWNSSGVVGSFGARAGFGAHGNLLSEALPCALAFYEGFDHSSILKTPLHTHGSPQDEKFLRRFSHLRPSSFSFPGLQSFWETGLLVDMRAFMGEIKCRNSLSPLCTRVKEYITSWEQVDDRHDAVLYAPGALRHLMALDDLASRPRQGSLLVWEGDFFRQSFHHDFYGLGSISYRKEHGKLMVGAQNGAGMTSLGHLGKALDLYDRLAPLCPEGPLPPFAKAKMISGVRELGVGRRAALNDLGRGLYSMSGLYKNGLTLAPFLAKKLVDSINIKRKGQGP
ncbi:MAG: FAD-dependent oxidoreductase [Bacteriovoracales bacterium]|nr:FAD-dependent oxidoreductase [Bacteriovoracales bacterium]